MKSIPFATLLLLAVTLLATATKGQERMKVSPFHLEPYGHSSHFTFTKVAIRPNVRTRICVSSSDSMFSICLFDSVLANAHDLVISDSRFCTDAHDIYRNAMIVCEPALKSGEYVMSFSTPDSSYSSKFIYIK